MKRSIIICLCLTLLLTACQYSDSSFLSAPSSRSELQPSSSSSLSGGKDAGAYLDQLMENMSLEEQVSQLFIIRLGSKDSPDFKSPTDDVIDYLRNRQPGGYTLFANHVTDTETMRALTNSIREKTPMGPIISIDEEGGRISRLTAGGLPGYQNQPTAAQLGASGQPSLAHDAGADISAQLNMLGINLNFAPVADVAYGEGNSAVGDRAFGSDPAVVAEMATAYMQGLHQNSVMAAAKHFPGHGGTKQDSHDAAAILECDAAHLLSVEYPPFEALIDAGCDFVMLGHILVPAVDSSGLPASLSFYFATEVLRNQLGFEGIIITDALEMDAITLYYENGEACILALQAGVDMLLLPQDYESAVQAVVQAVQQGRLPHARIRESLSRVLALKLQYGLLDIAV